MWELRRQQQGRQREQTFTQGGSFLPKTLKLVEDTKVQSSRIKLQENRQDTMHSQDPSKENDGRHGRAGSCPILQMQFFCKAPYVMLFPKNNFVYLALALIPFLGGRNTRKCYQHKSFF